MRVPFGTGTLGVGKNPLCKSLAETRERFFDAANIAKIRAGADDHEKAVDGPRRPRPVKPAKDP